MKFTLAAILSFQAVTLGAAFAPVAVPARTHVNMQAAKAGAASSAEEDLMLTLKVIMDHAARSTTASKDQYISQMETTKSAPESSEPVDISVPYDATAQLAYDKSDKSMAFEDFKVQYLADAVADVIAKQAPKAAAPAPAAPAAPAPAAPKAAAPAADVDISVPYDAAARLAYAKTDKSMHWGTFKARFEAQAVADVIAKQAPKAAAPAAAAPAAAAPASDDISVPYDAAAKLAYEKSDKSMEYGAFKTKFEADAVADVTAKQKKAEPVAA